MKIDKRHIRLIRLVGFVVSLEFGRLGRPASCSRALEDWTRVQGLARCRHANQD